MEKKNFKYDSSKIIKNKTKELDFDEGIIIF